MLKEDKRAIFTAASKATKAAQFLERAGEDVQGTSARPCEALCE
ncbi:MAG: hypothetical protein GY809_02480 [Planctomycetes bacterium]|nr:hypothetical protein [Planctomycetota bacterium]